MDTVVVLQFVNYADAYAFDLNVSGELTFVDDILEIGHSLDLCSGDLFVLSQDLVDFKL